MDSINSITQGVTMKHSNNGAVSELSFNNCTHYNTFIR